MYTTYFSSDKHGGQWFRFTLDHDFNVISREKVAHPDYDNGTPYEPNAKQIVKAIRKDLSLLPAC
jgi:hypothetical protein